jgi:enolase
MGIVQNSSSDCPPALSYAVHEGIGHDVNCHLQLVADSAVKTPEDVSRVDAEGVFDTLKVNLFKAGSVYKALQLVKAAKAAKWAVIVGAEEHCNETNDDFIADFAVAVGAGQFSGGGFGSGECMSKFNRIMEIIREHDTIPFAGRNFRG